MIERIMMRAMQNPVFYAASENLGYIAVLLSVTVLPLIFGQ